MLVSLLLLVQIRERVFTLGDAQSCLALTSKLPPQDAMFNIDADVKKTTERHHRKCRHSELNFSDCLSQISSNDYILFGDGETPLSLPFVRPPSEKYTPPHAAILPLFTHLDTGRDGCITRQELGPGLVSSGQNGQARLYKGSWTHKSFNLD